MLTRTLALLPRFLLLVVVVTMLSAGAQFACLDGQTRPGSTDSGRSDAVSDQRLRFNDGELNDQFVDVISSGSR
jgi:hypothetical protein